MKQEHNQERDSMEKATERPWGINLAHGVPTIFSQSKTGYPAICMMSSGAEKPNNEANAALIVRAVNSYEKLVEALKVAEPWLGCEKDCTKEHGKTVENYCRKCRDAQVIRNAIIKAEGRS